MKVTISAANNKNLDIGIDEFFKLAPLYGNIHAIPPPQHCSICFKGSHLTRDCKACANCLGKDHFIKQCPFLQKTNQEPAKESLIVAHCSHQEPSSTTCPSNRKQRLLSTRTSNVFWKQPGEYDEKKMSLIQPIGPEGELLGTLAIDTEGESTSGHALSVAIAGYFKSKILGDQMVYFDYIC